MSASPPSETLQCALPGRRELRFVLAAHPQGLHCTRIVGQGAHDVIRYATLVRDRSQWRAMLAADEFARQRADFFARLAAAGERRLP